MTNEEVGEGGGRGRSAYLVIWVENYAAFRHLQHQLEGKLPCEVNVEAKLLYRNS